MKTYPLRRCEKPELGLPFTAQLEKHLNGQEIIVYNLPYHRYLQPVFF